MSKFNIFTIDLRVILSIIVATGVYALLLKFLQKNSPHRCSNERGGGSKAFWTMLKKNGTFLSGWLPLGHSIHKASTKRSNIRKYSTKQTKSPKFESISSDVHI